MCISITNKKIIIYHGTEKLKKQIFVKIATERKSWSVIGPNVATKLCMIVLCEVCSFETFTAKFSLCVHAKRIFLKPSQVYFMQQIFLFKLGNKS